jgi:hypothetical protein
MKNITKTLKAGAVAVFATLVFASSAFAGIGDDCANTYPNLRYSTGQGNTNAKIYCTTVYEDDKPVKIYGVKTSDCQQAATIVSNPESCKGNDLNSIITIIINTLIFAIGIVAVVMIIMGGISYATSQGDPAKVKKGKDTILYGVIGVVVSLLAFAIVNFVLDALINGS